MIRRRLALRVLAVLLGAVGATVVPSSAQAVPNPVPPWSGHVYNGQSPHCLDASTPNVKLRTCDNTSYQQWLKPARFQPNSITTGGRCLDDGAGTNGYPVKVATCDFNNVHQKWYYNADFTIVNAASGRCLDADLGTINQEGTKVQVWDCAGGANQQWYFEFTPADG
ncbi:MAG TPA: RICIN domain-containing protein [Candidatus Limnocylindrales bacterium]|nr:RICIN domain-containing protein [Candidatus Limnocylindrales bacterium]